MKVTRGRSISGSFFLLHDRGNLLSNLFTEFKLVNYHGGLTTKVFGDRRLIVVITDGNFGALINSTVGGNSIILIERGFMMKVN